MRELNERIAKGEEIRDRVVTSEEELDAAKADYYTWDDFNTTLLRQRFTTTEIADDYARWAGLAFAGPRPLSIDVDQFRRDVDYKLRQLRSVKDRLPLYEQPAPGPVVVERRRAAVSGNANTIFIVHGRDEAPKLAVHGFLREVTTAKPVILHDQPWPGRTVIEKFEDHAGEAAFAVIVLTGDDVGALAGGGDPDLRPRGRQNVVFEFGFFVGWLGRNRVAVLYEEGVELPSDVEGLGYIPLDDRGAWKLPLAKELQAAGITVDATKLLG